MRRLGWTLTPALVAAGLVAGFGREMLLAYLYGTSREVEIFRVAFGLPSILSDAVAISFVGAMIPVLLAGEEDDEARRASLRQVLRASLAIAFGLLLLGVATMPVQAALFAPGFDGEARAALVTAGRLCWLMTFFVLISLPLRAWMSAGGRVWPGASAPLTRSLGFAGALALLAASIGPAAPLAPALAAPLAGLAVLGLHVVAIGGGGCRDIARALASGGFAGALGPLVPALLLVLAAQLLISGPRVLDRMFASTMQEGVLAAVEHGYSLVLAVIAVLVAPANLALAPRIGRAIRATGRVAARERRVLALVVLAAAAAGAVLAATAVPAVRLVFERGSFGAASTRLTAGVFEWQALGMAPAVLAILLTQVLILSGRQRAVLALAAAKLGVKAAALAVLLAAGMGPAAFGQSFVVAETAWAALLLGALLWRR